MIPFYTLRLRLESAFFLHTHRLQLSIALQYLGLGEATAYATVVRREGDGDRLAVTESEIEVARAVELSEKLAELRYHKDTLDERPIVRELRQERT